MYRVEHCKKMLAFPEGMSIFPDILFLILILFFAGNNILYIMDSLSLKNIQEPMKEKYWIGPAVALVTLKASATAGENMSCKVSTGKALIEAGFHPSTGCDGLLAYSGDMLLDALRQSK